MPQVVGLDIGSRTVKAALFERGFRGLELSSFHRAEFDPADAEGLSRALAEIAGRLSGGAPTVVARIPGDRVLLRFLDLPITDARKLDAVIPFEVESQVPYELDDLIIDHAIVRRSPEGAKVLVAAARRDDVRESLEQLGSQGLEPRYVAPGPSALSGLALALPALAKGTVALVDAGFARTDVCILQDGRPVFVRTISGGLADVAGAHPSGGGDLSALEAVDLASPGVPEDAGVRAAAEFVAREVRRTLLAANLESQITPEKLVVFGGLSRLRGFVALLERLTQVLAEPLSAGGAEWAKTMLSGSAEAEAGAAIALAFRVAGDAAMPNFRRDEFAFKRDAKELSSLLTRVVAAGAIVLFLAFVHFVVKDRLLASEKKALDKEIASEVLSAFPDAPKDRLKDGDAAVSIMQGNVADAEQRLAQLGSGTGSALDILKDISEAAPDGMYIDVKELEFADGKVRMRVVLDSYQDSDRLTEALRKVKMFQNVETNDDGNDVGTGKRRVTVKFDVNPQGSGEEA